MTLGNSGKRCEGAVLVACGAIGLEIGASSRTSKTTPSPFWLSMRGTVAISTSSAGAQHRISVNTEIQKYDFTTKANVALWIG